MKLITTIQELNQYVTVASDFDERKILKYTEKAERKLIKLISKEKFDEVVAMPVDEELRILLSEYSANMGLSLALPNLSVNITNAGIFTNRNSNSEPAQWHQNKDLNRSLLAFSFSSLDDAIQIIGVENIVSLKDLMITSVSVFEKYYSISGSAQTFMNLIPTIREVQNEYIKTMLGECYDSALPESMRENICAAIANLTIAKVVDSGSFTVQPNAIVLRLEVLPWEKVEKLDADRLERLKSDRISVAKGYLGLAKKELILLPCYVPKEISSDIIKHTSGLFLT